ncbi:MAG: hypothetical protein M0R68_11540 [Bacteroidetes bacterium]|nr:hypothetical protein [Bacteroidota bacterium]
MNKQITLYVLVLCIGITLSSAQYKKKVVSFVDHVVTASSTALTDRQASYIASMFSKSITMERFNYASLPENVVSSFVAQSSGMSSANAEQVRATIEKTLAPKFLELLDINKEMLSKQNLSETERNTFLATKAQSAGLSASQLESILNSGFFFVPYVEYFRHDVERGEREEKNEKGKVVRKVPTITHSHSIKAGLLWFQLIVDKSNTAAVRYIGAANGWKGNAIDRGETKDVEHSEGLEWETFSEVVNISAVNVGNETKKLEEFKLTGSISETTMFGVMLNLGSREGVGLDDSYWIEELEETESGDVIKSRRGFVKIREVGNNKNDESATSYAQTITGSNYSPGLSVTEIPMIGLNAVFGLGSMPVNIKPFDNTVAVGSRAANFGLSKSGYDLAVKVTGETKSAFGPFIWFQGSLANSSKISELWFHAGASLGFLSFDGKFYLLEYNSIGLLTRVDSTNDIGVALTGYANFGLVKKFYLRRFALVLQADVKYWLTDLTTSGQDSKGDNLDYSLSNDALGFDGRAGIEMYLTPMLSIGAGAEYNIFATDNIWTATVTDKDKKETKNSEAVGPDTKYSGLGVYLWINYALPSLF